MMKFLKLNQFLLLVLCSFLAACHGVKKPSSPKNNTTTPLPELDEPAPAPSAPPVPTPVVSTNARWTLPLDHKARLFTTYDNGHVVPLMIGADSSVPNGGARFINFMIGPEIVRQLPGYFVDAVSIAPFEILVAVRESEACTKSESAAETKSCLIPEEQLRTLPISLYFVRTNSVQDLRRISKLATLTSSGPDSPLYDLQFLSCVANSGFKRTMVAGFKESTGKTTRLILQTFWIETPDPEQLFTVTEHGITRTLSPILTTNAQADFTAADTLPVLQNGTFRFAWKTSNRRDFKSYMGSFTFNTDKPKVISQLIRLPKLSRVEVMSISGKNWVGTANQNQKRLKKQVPATVIVSVTGKSHHIAALPARFIAQNLRTQFLAQSLLIAGNTLDPTSEDDSSNGGTPIALCSQKPKEDQTSPCATSTDERGFFYGLAPESVTDFGPLFLEDFVAVVNAEGRSELWFLGRQFNLQVDPEDHHEPMSFISHELINGDRFYHAN